MPLDHFDPGALLVIRDRATQLDRFDGCGARALFSLLHLVIHGLTFPETVEGLALDLGVVEEQIVTLPLDKPESPL